MRRFNTLVQKLEKIKHILYNLNQTNFLELFFLIFVIYHKLASKMFYGFLVNYSDLNKITHRIIILYLKFQ